MCNGCMANGLFIESMQWYYSSDLFYITQPAIPFPRLHFISLFGLDFNKEVKHGVQPESRPEEQQQGSECGTRSTFPFPYVTLHNIYTFLHIQNGSDKHCVIASSEHGE